MGRFFLSPSDVYVRSFLYLFCPLIKLYYTKALSNQASTLAPDWIPLPGRPRILTLFTAHGSKLSTSWHSWGNNENSDRLYFILGCKITTASDCSHEIKRHLLLGRKAVTNLDSVLKSRDITLPTKIHRVKALVFPVIMYGCESWTIKTAEHWRFDAFELWCWRRLLQVPWTARRSNQPILKEINHE